MCKGHCVLSCVNDMFGNSQTFLSQGHNLCSGRTIVVYRPWVFYSMTVYVVFIILLVLLDTTVEVCDGKKHLRLTDL